ncbi:MAG: hypothetical protein R3C16_04850 [Hyphomonadaceae bacterium]
MTSSPRSGRSWARCRSKRASSEIDAMYSGYLERQALDVEAFKRDEDYGFRPISITRALVVFQRSAREARRGASGHARPGFAH